MDDAGSRAVRVAKDLWGFTELREGQVEAIRAACRGQDCFVGLATGQGKSLCYQILPSISKESKIVIVISPLQALVSDQIHRYETVTGYKGIHLRTVAEIKEFQQTPDNNVRMVFMAPEQAVSTEGRHLLQNPPLPIALVAVDEAHCIPEWGADFRKAFSKLGELRALLPKVPFMALTATATAEVRNSVTTALHMDDPVVVEGSLDRPNILILSKKIKSTKEDFQPLIEHLREARTSEDIRKHIVYATTKDTVMAIWEELHANCKGAVKKAVVAFHADISSEAKATWLQRFREGSVRVIVSSIAFGMGIDIPDVRGVVVYHVPSTIGQLYQEIGRVGRDGEQASAIIFNGKGDLKKAKDEVKAFVAADGCLRADLLNHLGQEMPAKPDQCCSHCNTADDTESQCIFFNYKNEPRQQQAGQKRRRARPDTGMSEELEKRIKELRKEWYAQRPELWLFGPYAVMADETVQQIGGKCKTIHTAEDLEKISGIPEGKAQDLLAVIDHLYPEYQPTRRVRARRTRVARQALQDISNTL
ncbi:ATP-dependent DNA helicase RecQ-like [Branchiostoma lanceolatum]|uniref:ATP-dependent DNA helicase RecQ-like n=1 Tax=Branchiostoma lanceolatum TaxID=7740 RepID=UPI003453D5F2